MFRTLKFFINILIIKVKYEKMQYVWGNKQG